MKKRLKLITLYFFLIVLNILYYLVFLVLYIVLFIPLQLIYPQEKYRRLEQFINDSI